MDNIWGIANNVAILITILTPVVTYFGKKVFYASRKEVLSARNMNKKKIIMLFEKLPTNDIEMGNLIFQEIVLFVASFCNAILMGSLGAIFYEYKNGYGQWLFCMVLCILICMLHICFTAYVEMFKKIYWMISLLFLNQLIPETYVMMKYITQMVLIIQMFRYVLKSLDNMMIINKVRVILLVTIVPLLWIFSSYNSFNIFKIKGVASEYKILFSVVILIYAIPTTIYLIISKRYKGMRYMGMFYRILGIEEVSLENKCEEIISQSLNFYFEYIIIVLFLSVEVISPLKVLVMMTYTYVSIIGSLLIVMYLKETNESIESLTIKYELQKLAITLDEESNARKEISRYLYNKDSSIKKINLCYDIRRIDKNIIHIRRYNLKVNKGNIILNCKMKNGRNLNYTLLKDEWKMIEKVFVNNNVNYESTGIIYQKFKNEEN